MDTKKPSFLPFSDLSNVEVNALIEDLKKELERPDRFIVTPDVENPTLKIKKLFEDATIPTKAHETDSGFDLYAYKVERLYDRNQLVDFHMFSSPDPKKEIYLSPGQRCLVNTGISATVKPGYEIQIRPRSGNALKKGLTVLNTPGTIDESYRGMIGVILYNSSNVQVTVQMGDRIAQMVVSPVILPYVEIVEDLDTTARNDGGFGHTGN